MEIWPSSSRGPNSSLRCAKPKVRSMAPWRRSDPRWTHFRARRMFRRNRGILPSPFLMRLCYLALPRCLPPRRQSHAIARRRSLTCQSERWTVALLRADHRSRRSAKRCTPAGHMRRRIRVFHMLVSRAEPRSHHRNRLHWNALGQMMHGCRWSLRYGRCRRHHCGNRRLHRPHGNRPRRRDRRRPVVQTWAEALTPMRLQQRLKRRLSGRWIGSYMYPPPTITTGARHGANPSVSHPNTFDSPWTGLVAQNRRPWPQGLPGSVPVLTHESTLDLTRQPRISCALLSTGRA